MKIALKLGEISALWMLRVGGEINAQYGFTYGGDAQERLAKYMADWANAVPHGGRLFILHKPWQHWLLSNYELSPNKYTKKHRRFYTMHRTALDINNIN